MMVVTAVIELFPPFKPKPFTFCKSVDKYFRLSPVLVVQLSVNTAPAAPHSAETTHFTLEQKK